MDIHDRVLGLANDERFGVFFILLNVLFCIILNNLPKFLMVFRFGIMGKKYFNRQISTLNSC